MFKQQLVLHQLCSLYKLGLNGNVLKIGRRYRIKNEAAMASQYEFSGKLIAARIFVIKS